MMQNLLVACFFLLVPVLSQAQIVVQGNVRDISNNEPLIGTFITVKGFSNAVAMSEVEGKYQLIVPTPKQAQNIIISVSHLGYKEKQIVLEILPMDDRETIIQNIDLESDPLALQQIIVTANKVEEEMQSVPIAVTAITAKDMENRTVSTTTDALASIPNLVTDGYLPNQPTFSLRGLASNFDNNGVENAVALYIDEVFFSRAYNFNTTLMDIERVEVLRGPQGTLFGKNSVGGVIHVVSEAPKMANSAGVELSAGNYNFYQLRAKGNVQLIKDKLAMRVAVAYKSRDGWLIDENEKLSENNGTLFYGARLSMLYQPTKKLKVLVRGDFGKDDKADFTLDYIPSSFGHRLVVADTNAYDRRSHQNEDGIFFNRQVYGTSGKIEYQLDKNHTITALTSINSSKSDFLKDFDVSLQDATNFTKNAETDAFSQEIRISTPRENRKLFYIAGLYFLKENIKTRDSISLHEIFSTVWQQQFGFPDVQVIPGYFEYVSPNSDVTSTSMAGYLAGSVEMSNQIRFNGGLRFTNEKKDLSFFQNVGADYGLISLAVAQVGSRQKPLLRSVDDKEISFNAGLDFQTTDRILLFINLSRGFKGAGFNTEFAPDSLGGTLVFKPEYVNNYEFGMKIKYTGRYRLNMTAFVTDYKNKQETAPGGSAYRVANAKSAQGIGVEAELAAILAKGLRLDASAGLLRLRYLDFPFSDRNGQPINLSGARLYKAPNITFQASPSYSANIGTTLRLRAQLDFFYVGKTYNDIYNTEALAREGKPILNGRLEFSTPNNKYSLALWAKNITDAVFFQHAWEFNFGSHVAINPPRMLGVELRVNFF